MPEFSVSRSIEIDASPEKVFDVVADYSTWPAWSPWLLAEPEARVSISDDPGSVGSRYAWEGSIVGHGELEHQTLEPGRRINDQIRIRKPWKSDSKVAFEFEKVGNGTRVTWQMNGSMPLMMGWMVPMMKTLIGMDYQRGLKMLREWIETGTIQSETEIRGVVPFGPLRVVGVRRSATVDDCADIMCGAITEAVDRLQAAGLPMDDLAASVYHDFNTKSGVFEFTVGFVMPLNAGAAPDGMSDWLAPATIDAFCVAHTGSYQHLGNPWNAAHQNVRGRKLKQSRLGAVELYRNNPENTPEAELVTEIYLPLRKKILGLF